MKQSSREFLEDISNYCSSESTRYKYSKIITQSQKYKKGKLAAIDFMQELTYHYMSQEQHLKSLFIESLKRELDNISALNDGDYKAGIKDAINEVIVKVKSV